MQPAQYAPAVGRRRLEVRGTVQGVGFRPFVYRLATGRGLVGWVLNDGRGVVIEVQGPASELDAFARELVAQAPPLARIVEVAAASLPLADEADFRIADSSGTASTAAIPPDTATCADCLRELFDPRDRRHRYPFINCTQCGPRLTIVVSVPYDRRRTTMDRFVMCDACRREYEDPRDRRFHAEPIACPECGPSLSMPIAEALQVIDAGGIVAVKGLGGYHLACDATNEAAVARLRARKHREDKPFAVMAADPAALVVLDDRQELIIAGPERPIVIARARPGCELAPSLAPGSDEIGVMLPYTPLHHLLVRDAGRPLVMTSGNSSDEPIAIDDDDARARLGAIADAFLAHDRPIHRRCEDSVVRGTAILRRSRGYAPSPLPLAVAAQRPILATGAELKATFCVAQGHSAWLSPHLGDLGSELAWRAFGRDLRLYLDMLGVEPAVIAHDLHPGYLSTSWALDQPVDELVAVQHHHAHAAAVLAEHGRTDRVQALVFDGAGYGSDGTIWGGELLACDLSSFERLDHLGPVPLPGGDAAVREPWRLAAMHLERAGRPVPWPRWQQVRVALAADPPRTSSMGRLFDAVAALVVDRVSVTYEGQGAVELERAAGDLPATPWAWRLGDPTELVRTVHDELAGGRPPAQVAAAFHETIAAASADACAEQAASGAPRTVVLSGGCFQNLRLSEATERRLRAHGLDVLTHRQLPSNDGSISYGQAAVASARQAC